MSHIQAIYENGVLRPLAPLDLEENTVVDIDIHDDEQKELDKDKWLKFFREWMDSLDPNTPALTDEQISRESIYEEQILRQL